MNIKLSLRSTLIMIGLTLSLLSSQAYAKKAEDKTSLLQLALAANSEGPYMGSFDTLIAAVLAADPAVISTLSSKGQHTVFAPTDDAFGLLGLDENNIGDLPQDTLTTILLYHVVHGRQLAEDVLASDKLNTLIKGKNGFLYQDGGMLTDNLDRVVSIIVTDLEAANGVIHVIDGVVLPAAP